MKSEKLTTLELYWYIIGAAVGSGLFVLLPIAIGYTGRSVVLVLLVAGLIRVANDIFSVAMAAMFPLKGGQYSQVSYLASPLLSGVYGMIWLITSLTMAAYATSAISYGASLFPGIAPYTKPMAVAIVTLFFAMNYFGAKTGAKFQGTMTVILLTALGLFVIFGLPKVDFGNYVDANFFMDGLPGFSGALAMCMWATEGIMSTASALSSEVEKPTYTLPRAMIGSLTIVVVIYVAIIIVAAGALPIEEVAFQDMTVVAQHIFPRGLFIFFVLGGAVMALMTSLMGSVTVFRYPFEQMADDGWLPAVFKKRASNGWPWVCMVVMYVMVLMPVIFSISFDKVVSYVTFPVTFIVAYVNLKCMILPKRYPDLWKKSLMRKIPMSVYNIICVIGALANLYMAYCYCAEMTAKDVVLMVLLTVLLFAYCQLRLKTKKVNVIRLEAEKRQSKLKLLNISVPMRTEDSHDFIMIKTEDRKIERGNYYEL